MLVHESVEESRLPQYRRRLLWSHQIAQVRAAPFPDNQILDLAVSELRRT